MQLVERHVIKRGDSRFQTIDRAAFALEESLQRRELTEKRQESPLLERGG